MNGPHFAMISEVSGAAWVVMATALVVFGVAAIRNRDHGFLAVEGNQIWDLRNASNSILLWM